MKKRLAEKMMKKSERPAAVGPPPDPSLAANLSDIRHSLDEVAEDNLTLRDGVKRVAEGLDGVRSLLVQEVGQLRVDLAGEMLAQFLRSCCRELSPILNAMETMLAGADFSDPAATRGHVESLAMTLDAAMARLGMERVPLAVGEDLFDSRIHDCVRVCTPCDSPLPDAPERTVVRLQEPGYTVRGRLVQPAKVWVQKREEPPVNSQKEANS